jgi:hypothetical protein
MYKILILNMVEICTTQNCSSALHNCTTGLRFFFGGGGWSYDYKWLWNAPLWYKSTTTASVINSEWKQLISFLLWRILEITELSEEDMSHFACAIALSLIIRSSQRIPKVFSVWKTAVSIISTRFAYGSTCKLSIHHFTVLHENHKAMYISPIQLQVQLA